MTDFEEQIYQSLTKSHSKAPGALVTVQKKVQSGSIGLLACIIPTRQTFKSNSSRSSNTSMVEVSDTINIKVLCTAGM